jgi:hypothetical protein
MVFYSKSTGNLDDSSTWGINTDGTGTNPVNFTTANQVFNIRNGNPCGLTGNWTISGSDASAVLGDGSTAITFSTGNNTISGTFRLANNATLEIGSNSTGLKLFCEAASTVNYNGTGSQTIASGQYHHLTLSNNRSGGTITLDSGSIFVPGNMTNNMLNVGSWVNTSNSFNYISTGAQQVAALNYNNLTISGNKNNNILTLQSGKVGVGGTFTLSATGISSWTTTGNTLEYNGSAAQTVLSAVPYLNLSISGTNTKTLDGNTSIAGDLVLSNKLVLGNFNLTISGNTSGGSSSNYVVAGGAGSLIKNIGTSASFAFPVGNSAYNPVSITNKTTSSDQFSVRILDEVYYLGTTGNVITEPRVKRTWLIDKTTPSASSGSGVDFTFNWNSGEMVSITVPALYHFNGTTWQKQTTGVTSFNTSSLTYTGYKGSFSPFSIGDNIILLPVTWLNFRCESEANGATQLQWQTATEQNSNTFFVERSSDGNSYSTIGELAAAGISQTFRSYSFTDRLAPLSGAYYRIRMLDMKGDSSYSDVCKSYAGMVNNPAPLKVFPNPTDGVINMFAPDHHDNFVWEIFSATGQRVAVGHSKDGKANARLHKFSEGIYSLRVVGYGLTQNHKILVQH